MWVIFVFAAVIIYVRAIYKPEWEDLDKRPLPQWYDVAKIGIFVHWGLYAVPAHKSEWFWHYWQNDDADVLNFTKCNNYSNYEDFAEMLTGESFEPDEWADLFYKAGAQYVVLTTKHHDGFALFKSSGAHNWNSVQSGPKKDIVDLLSQSVRSSSMKFGIYYSLLDWYSNKYSIIGNKTASKMIYVDNVMIPDIQQLIMEYEPSVLWADGDWDEHSDIWKSREVLAWIYNDSPVKDEIVVNDRWGIPARNQHGDFYNGQDRLNPKTLLHHKWENALSLDRKSWGYRSEMDDIIGIEELIEDLVSTISCGGNVLINVGPTKEGIIVPVFRKRLLQLGVWLQINGEAIYDTSPWYHQNDSLNPYVWYTCKKQKYNPWRTSHVPDDTDTVIAIYVIFLKWPHDDLLLVQDLSYYLRNKEFNIYFLAPDENGGNNTQLNYNVTRGVLKISIPRVSYGLFHGAWSLKIIRKEEK